MEVAGAENIIRDLPNPKYEVGIITTLPRRSVCESVDCIHLSQVQGSCKHVLKLLGSTKGGKFLHYFLTKHTSPWS